MKKNIHPIYHTGATASCSCGNSFTVGSTKKEIKTEICSKCHPFYTGQHKLVDTAGRVDKFLAKQKKADAAAEKGLTKKKSKVKQRKKKFEVEIVDKKSDE